MVLQNKYNRLCFALQEKKAPAIVTLSQCGRQKHHLEKELEIKRELEIRKGTSNTLVFTISFPKGSKERLLPLTCTSEHQGSHQLPSVSNMLNYRNK